jgi:anti-anti-sigma factor
VIARWKEFALPVASIAAPHPYLVSSDAVQTCGRAVFTASDLAADRVLVRVKGEVDATNRQALGRFVERHFRVSKQLLLDLSGVDFFGSQGFTALYYLSVQCARRDVDWMIVGSRPVLRILRICDPDGQLPVIGDIADALSRLEHVAKCRHAVAWAD